MNSVRFLDFSMRIPTDLTNPPLGHAVEYVLRIQAQTRTHTWRKVRALRAGRGRGMSTLLQVL
jgi:hypothetical protein